MRILISVSLGAPFNGSDGVWQGNGAAYYAASQLVQRSIISREILESVAVDMDSEMSGNTGIRGAKLFAEKQCGIGSCGAYCMVLA